MRMPKIHLLFGWCLTSSMCFLAQTPAVGNASVTQTAAAQGRARPIRYPGGVRILPWTRLIHRASPCCTFQSRRVNRIVYHRPRQDASTLVICHVEKISIWRRPCGALDGMRWLSTIVDPGKPRRFDSRTIRRIGGLTCLRVRPAHQSSASTSALRSRDTAWAGG